jgi:hypothetical protein
MNKQKNITRTGTESLIRAAGTITTAARNGGMEWVVRGERM